MGWVTDLRIDSRISIRSFLRDRRFVAVALATLAVGIGANTALFAVVNSLFRPLPYDRPENLVEITLPARGLTFDDLSHAGSFTGVAAFLARGFPVIADGEV